MRTMLAISPSLFISPNGRSTLDVSSAIRNVWSAALPQAKNDLGEFFRRITRKLG
jgi:hypothetical protein